MKTKYFLIGLAATALIACNSSSNENSDEAVSTDIVNNPSSASTDATNKDLPSFDFEEEVIDFGDISQGEKVKRMFRFTNNGKTDLIISDAKGSCGCTVPRWPRQPIRPGQQGDIEVVFDSNGKQGRQHKTVTLVANTVPNTKVIAIKGNVLVPTK